MDGAWRAVAFLHSTDTQNILEVLSFGILNKKNAICLFCQPQFAKTPFDT